MSRTSRRAARWSAAPRPSPAPGDGYLVRRTDALPVRFALNMERLDEIRARFELMEQINPALVENYAAELGR